MNPSAPPLGSLGDESEDEAPDLYPSNLAGGDGNRSEDSRQAKGSCLMKCSEEPSLNRQAAAKVTTPRPVPSQPHPSRLDWTAIAREGMEAGDMAMVEAVMQAFPVQYEQEGEGDLRGGYLLLGWKLSQLRATVNDSGLHGEPMKQMLNYIWGSSVLAPEDIKVIACMIMSQSEQLLWQSHWQRLCEISSNTQAEGDPLFGVTVQQLMGMGPFATPDMQVHLGPDVCLESMQTARQALEMIKTSTPTPSYMSIKQGREESFASFIEAINRACVPDWLKATLLRQCAMENCNSSTRSILITLPIDATIEIMLERMSRVPAGLQALLVEAVRELGSKVAEAQTQAFAALASLVGGGVPKGAQPQRSQGPSCYRCGKERHWRRDCRAKVWCENCNSANHSMLVCCASGNSGTRVKNHRAQTTMAALVVSPLNGTLSNHSLPAAVSHEPPLQTMARHKGGALAWTWQPQQM